MRVVVTGATGNVGTAVIRALRRDPAVTEIVGVELVAADVVSDDLVPVFRWAAVVIHLAWLIQPARDRDLTHGVNVGGSERVFRAAAEAGVPALVYASSVGAYS